MPSNQISLQNGALEAAVLEIIDAINKKGQLPALLEAYIAKGEIAEARFTPQIKMAMIDYLMERGIQIDDMTKFNAGEYDEHFALAYDYAVNTSSGKDDPLDAVRRPGAKQLSNWDFSVETFEGFEEQGVIPENILAAGALDYIYELGENMGVFKLTDALVLGWSAGSIDVVEGEIASRLYRYWKFLDDRATAEERGMVYRRVLNKGDAEVLSRMSVNEHFPNLWHSLMGEVADYIDKSERLSDGMGETSSVSRARIYQATRELQYNLTEYCTGMAHVQAQELYAQLQECFDILRDPEIMAYFGGKRRKSLWTVIEQLSKEEFGSAPNISAVRSLAVDGNRVFQWIANFNEATVTQEQFTDFLQAAEAYILNFTTPMDSGDQNDMMEDDDFESFDGFDEEDDF